MIKARGIWVPAIEYSSLDIIPACTKRQGERTVFDYECICSNVEDATDTLVISDGTAEYRQEVEKKTGKKMKVDDLDLSNVHNNTDHTGFDKRSPAWITFGWIYSSTLFEVMTAADRDDDIITSMAHELGHVFGLFHEHQRPDAARYVTFTPQCLKSYDETLAKILSRRYKSYFPKGMDNKNKMESVLEHPRVAKILIPDLKNWLPENGALHRHHSLAIYSPDNFDYGSIMIYSSASDIAYPASENLARRRCPLKRKYPKADGNTDIWTSGHQFKGRVSIGDVRRIAELYPGTAEQQDAVRSIDQWKSFTYTGFKDEDAVDDADKYWVKEWVIKPNPIDDSQLEDTSVEPEPELQAEQDPGVGNSRGNRGSSRKGKSSRKGESSRKGGSREQGDSRGQGGSRTQGDSRGKGGSSGKGKGKAWNFW